MQNNGPQSHRPKAKLILISVPARDFRKDVRFYEDFLGLDFTRSLTDKSKAYHAQILKEGVFLSISDRDAPSEGVVCFFAVEDLDEAMKEVVRLGGRVKAPPFDLPIHPSALDGYKKLFHSVFGIHPGEVRTIGTAAVAEDPAGQLLGLIQLDPHAELEFKAGRHAEPIPHAIAGHLRDVRALSEGVFGEPEHGR
jgi:predicted enzyme related to lactoylglutathione lyase